MSRTPKLLVTCSSHPRLIHLYRSSTASSPWLQFTIRCRHWVSCEVKSQWVKLSVWRIADWRPITARREKNCRNAHLGFIVLLTSYFRGLILILTGYTLHLFEVDRAGSAQSGAATITVKGGLGMEHCPWWHTTQHNTIHRFINRLFVLFAWVH